MEEPRPESETTPAAWGAAPPRGRAAAGARWGQASAPARVASWLGLALHLVVGVMPYSGSGLVAPVWAAWGLYVSWALLLGLWLLARRRRPWLAAAVPLLALGWWVAVVTTGDLAAGWTA